MTVPTRRPAEPPQRPAGELVDGHRCGPRVVAVLGEGGHLDEVEVVEQADPGDAEQQRASHRKPNDDNPAR